MKTETRQVLVDTASIIRDGAFACFCFYMSWVFFDMIVDRQGYQSIAFECIRGMK